MVRRMPSGCFEWASDREVLNASFKRHHLSAGQCAAILELWDNELKKDALTHRVLAYGGASACRTLSRPSTAPTLVDRVQSRFGADAGDASLVATAVPIQTHKHQRAASEVSMRGKGAATDPQNIDQNTEDQESTATPGGMDPQLCEGERRPTSAGLSTRADGAGSSNPMRGLFAPKRSAARPMSPNIEAIPNLRPSAADRTREDSALIYMQVQPRRPRLSSRSYSDPSVGINGFRFHQASANSYRHFCEATPSSGPTMDHDSSSTCVHAVGRPREIFVVTEEEEHEEDSAHGVGVQVLGVDDETEAPRSSPTFTAADEHLGAHRYDRAPLGSPASVQDSKSCTWVQGDPAGRPATAPGSFQDLLELARQYCAAQQSATRLPGLGSALLRGRGLAVPVGGPAGSPSNGAARAARAWSPSSTNRSPSVRKPEATKARGPHAKARPVWRQIANEAGPKPFV